MVIFHLNSALQMKVFTWEEEKEGDTHQHFDVVVADVESFQLGQLRHGFGQRPQQVLAQLHTLQVAQTATNQQAAISNQSGRGCSGPP